MHGAKFKILSQVRFSTEQSTLEPYSRTGIFLKHISIRHHTCSWPALIKGCLMEVFINKVFFQEKVTRPLIVVKLRCENTLWAISCEREFSSLQREVSVPDGAVVLLCEIGEKSL
jgi:hypothetical protein